MSKHTDLIDKVNDAKTEREHREAELTLRGWRQGYEDAGRRLDWMEGDNHTMERFGEDRPMCVGVLLDWKPEDAPPLLAPASE